LSREHHGPRAILNALNWLANSYGNQCDSTQQELTIAETQLRDYQARLGTPFVHDGYLTQLTNLRDQLKAGLAAPPTPQATESQPTVPEEAKPMVAELAEQIKALKSANTIEATPQRVGKRRSSAEEPVTARIRRRAKPVPTPDQVSEPDAAAMPTEAPAPPESTVIPMHREHANNAAPAPDVNTVEEPTDTPDEEPAEERFAMNQRRRAVQLSLF
jgi:hypothetical protein